MKILVLNGPNLNLLGRREPEIYGSRTMESCLEELRTLCDIEYFQSNHVGELIDCLQRVGFDHSYAGVVFNAGAYTHTSLALADAIASIELPVVEVHISNVYARPEQIRHRSLIAPVCRGVITGFGLDSYRLAVLSLMK